MFKINPLYLTDGYKVGHKAMLAEGTTKLYATWIPRNIKYAPEGITKVVSFGQQLTWRYIYDMFEEYFFFTEIQEESIYMNAEKSDIYIDSLKQKALQFVKDMSLYLGMEYDGRHFEELWNLGYLPIKVKSLPEGLETDPNIPHMTFINTVDGFAWLTLFLETMVSNLSWKASTAATIAKLYRRQAEEWVAKTDPENSGLIDFMCHDFSARGLSGQHDMISVGLAHATSFKGSDTLATIPASRYYYNVKENETPIFSVNASEHSVSTTKIFTVGEQQMIADWLKIFPKGILSLVSDTFDLWKLITEYLPANKDAIIARDGKLVIRPDSGDPVDIICGYYVNKAAEQLAWGTIARTFEEHKERYENATECKSEPEFKGVIELLWDIFGGTINKQGYKVLDPHIGCIYGDSITPERQRMIYSRLAEKGFAATNIVLGVGSYTYEYLTRDALGFAAKGSWFEIQSNKVKGYGDCGTKCVNEDCKDDSCRHSYNIYKNPVTDDGTKRSLRGLLQVFEGKFVDEETGLVVDRLLVKQECTPEEESKGLLQVIYEDGNFFNQTTLEEVRTRLSR